ncbi:hypothetical protein Nepgr_001315 [Nepenthes gracilis]|uniref:Histidine-containing phosphotransfer protein n=1 Tax=Nepenthes gracilis TaxID=150966 RepID=A0AAD3P4L5_NEPGR|nr:hypothetical protein Nepgr_001315 [Nepenthes gracilis]
MAPKEALIERMQVIISELEEEGSLDENFRVAEDLKDVTGPYFFANLVPTFLTDTRITLRDLTRLLEEPSVDFGAVVQLAIKLRGATASIGTCSMARSCGNLRRAADNQTQERCMQALNEIKLEFSRIYDRLDEIVQIERRIVALGGI